MLLALVTKRNRNGDSQSVIKINKNPITKVTNVALHKWMVPIIEANREPQLPSNPAGNVNPGISTVTTNNPPPATGAGAPPATAPGITACVIGVLPAGPCP